MNFDPSLVNSLPSHSVVARLGAEEDTPVGLADLIAQNLNE